MIITSSRAMRLCIKVQECGIQSLTDLGSNSGSIAFTACVMLASLGISLLLNRNNINFEELLIGVQ